MSAGPRAGWCEPRLRQELAGLDLYWIEVELAAGRAPTAPSPPAVVERLRELSNRWRGARAVAVRGEQVPAAYRVLFRQLGLDPDVVRTPLEQALFVRMFEGGFRSRGLLDDVLVVALMDTGVPVWALDADTIDGTLGIRATGEGELVMQGAHGSTLGGRLVVAYAELDVDADTDVDEDAGVAGAAADSGAAVSVLFGEPLARYRPRRTTHRLLLYAVRAPGVSSLHVEEALWTCRSALVGDPTRP